MFGGRSKELFDTRRILFEDSQQSPCNVLTITGEPGIGKTSMAHELYKYSNEPKFEYRVAITAHMKTWAEIVPELAHEIEMDIPSKANESEIEKAILQWVVDRPAFVVLDNIVELTPQFIDFMHRWGTAQNSRLLITTNELFSKETAPSHCEVYALGGITEDYVIRDLLGDQMVDTINKCNMWDVLKKLKGNPQKMIYLRWRAPASCAEIEDCIRDLTRQAAWTEPLELVLQHTKLPVDHFLALARVRVPEIDEALLAHLWDEMALGTTEHYSRSLQKLLDEKLLEAIDLRKLRLSAGVHVQLQKPLLKAFGKHQIGFIDYFIGEYHRQQFSVRREDDYRLKYLDSYVYHMIESGNIDSAYAYVFEGDELDIARSRGLSVELERILGYFDLQFQRLLKQAETEHKERKNGDHVWARRAVMASIAKIELGRVYKDLSRHDQCLEAMDSALTLLDSTSTTYENRALVDRLRIKIDHFRGIAYSQIGRTLECIQAYFESIKRAAQSNSFGAIETLSLGYLAYELKFYNIDESVSLAKRAVEISRKIGVRNSIVKNLCSLGQIQSFAGNIEESKQSFGEAEQLCHTEPPDLRELGRILVNSAVTYVSNRLWQEAEDRLSEADKLFGESGDRRRKFMGRAYQGIILYHKGQKKKGMDLVHQAFQHHQSIGAEREMLYEALSFAWMSADGIAPEISEIPSRGDLPRDVALYAKEIPQMNLEIFVDFWMNYYMPTLLTFGWTARGVFQ
jgi:tetratricopeptide (TPR) repeat protein